MNAPSAARCAAQVSRCPPRDSGPSWSAARGPGPRGACPTESGPAESGPAESGPAELGTGHPFFPQAPGTANYSARRRPTLTGSGGAAHRRLPGGSLRAGSVLHGAVLHGAVLHGRVLGGGACPGDRRHPLAGEPALLGDDL